MVHLHIHLFTHHSLQYNSLTLPGNYLSRFKREKMTREYLFIEGRNNNKKKNCPSIYIFFYSRKDMLWILEAFYTISDNSCKDLTLVSKNTDLLPYKVSVNMSNALLVFSIKL